MKNINVKKVVAGAAALALGVSGLAVAIAANTGGTNFGPVTKGNVIRADGAPAATIVVGLNSLGSDSIWAGNIAAAIAQKAYTTETHTIEIPAVPGTTTPTTTVTGDGKLSDDLFDLGTQRRLELDDSDYTLLGDYDVRVDDDIFRDDKINVEELLNITAKIEFNDDKDIADLIATIDRDGIEYKLEFTPGIIKDTNDSGSPDLKFNLFGKQYTLEKYTGRTMDLVQNKSTTPYGVGANFEVEGHTIAVLEILESSGSGTNYEVEMSISKNGITLATEIYGDGDTIFDEFLTIDTEIDTVYNSRVTVVSGTSARIKLTDGQIVKDFPNIGDELWKVEFNGTTYSQGDTITTISLYNHDQDIRYKDDDALRRGNEISLPYNFAKISFLGLSDESEKEIIVEDGYLSYTDASDKDHKIFIYEYEDGTYETGDNYTTTQEIDGKSLYFDFNTTDDLNQPAANESGYFTVQLEDEDGKFLSKDNTWSWKSISTAGAQEKFYFDGNSSESNASSFTGFVPITIPLYKNESRKIAYGVYLRENTQNKITELAIALDSNATDTLDTGQSWTVGNIFYNIQTNDANATGYVGMTNSSATTVTDTDLKSMFALRINDSDENVTAYIDAYTGGLVDTDDSAYDAGLDQVVATSFNLNQEESDDLSFGYTIFGTKVEVDGETLTVTVPEDQLYGKIFVGKGEISTPGGTPGGTPAATRTYTTQVPATWDPNTLVRLDTANVTGTRIVVGGHIVNTLALGITESYLTQSGDYVMGMHANGNIYVAGWTATDTETAAKELIAAIRSM